MEGMATVWIVGLCLCQYQARTTNSRRRQIASTKHSRLPMHSVLERCCTGSMSATTEIRYPMEEPFEFLLAELGIRPGSMTRLYRRSLHFPGIEPRPKKLFRMAGTRYHGPVNLRGAHRWSRGAQCIGSPLSDNSKQKEPQLSRLL